MTKKTNPAGQGGANGNNIINLRKNKISPRKNQYKQHLNNNFSSDVISTKGARSETPSNTIPSDLANTSRFVKEHGHNIRYCADLGKWLFWNGGRWQSDGDGHVDRLAKSVSRKLLRHASQLTEFDARLTMVQWGLTSQSEFRIKAMISLAKTEPGIPVTPSELDRDRDLLGVENGTIDLKTGVLLRPDRSHLITKQAAVAFDPNAKAPKWEKFISEITNGDVELAAFIQRAVGYCLTGSTDEQCMFILEGTGSNGKGVFSLVVQGLLGDYAMTTPPETLLARRNTGGPTPDLARLAGARLVIASEPPDNLPIDEAVVKRITGQDVIACRPLYGNLFEYQPAFKIMLAANHKPEIRGTDHAIWRRIHLVPFCVTIPQERRDKNLVQKLLGERPGILNWALHGLHDYRVHGGLKPPASVRGATQAYRSQMDLLQEWLDERCEKMPGATTPIGDLYADYLAWCNTGRYVAIGKRKFGDDLDKRGFARARSASSRSHEGIRLK